MSSPTNSNFQDSPNPCSPNLSFQGLANSSFSSPTNAFIDPNLLNINQRIGELFQLALSNQQKINSLTNQFNHEQNELNNILQFLEQLNGGSIEINRALYSQNMQSTENMQAMPPTYQPLEQQQYLPSSSYSASSSSSNRTSSSKTLRWSNNPESSINRAGKRKRKEKHKHTKSRETSNEIETIQSTSASSIDSFRERKEEILELFQSVFENIEIDSTDDIALTILNIKQSVKKIEINEHAIDKKTKLKSILNCNTIQKASLKYYYDETKLKKNSLNLDQKTNLEIIQYILCNLSKNKFVPEKLKEIFKTLHESLEKTIEDAKQTLTELKKQTTKQKVSFKNL